MRLTFSGAAHEVTGSCHYLEACGHKIFVDYGMEQGEDFFENQPVAAAAAEIDYVFLTHAHIDHSGFRHIRWKMRKGYWSILPDVTIIKSLIYARGFVSVSRMWAICSVHPVLKYGLVRTDCRKRLSFPAMWETRISR